MEKECPQVWLVHTLEKQLPHNEQVADFPKGLRT